MASKEMSEWIKFFTSAGVPAGAATTYAVTFIDNRIQKTMLLDITKEYLKEMGITVMGDIIAILKYCKTYHAQYEREKPAISAMQVSADGKVEVKRQTTAGSRMLEYYMRKEGVIDGGDAKVKVSAGMAARLGAVPAVGAKKNSTTMPQSVEVVPVKKVRRVTPEQEGKYIINMPEGTTAKTKKILEEQQVKAAAFQGRKTVFDRLGGGSKEEATAVQKIDSPNSVFSRLGGKKKVRSLSASSDSVCEYEGVLRSPPNSTGKITTSTARRTRVAAPLTTASGVASRLGAKVTPKKIQAPVSSTSSTSKMDQINIKTSIKDRLGQQKPEVSSTSQISVPTKVQTRTTNLALKKAVISLDKSGVKSRLGSKEGLGIKKGGGVIKRLGTQLKPKEQTVTVRIPKDKGGLGQSTGMFARLGLQITPAASPSIKGRLGLQKAEASSTTPSITVMVSQKRAGLQSAKLNMKRKNSFNITRTVSNSDSSNVFNRLGTSE